jgi:prepilin-type N-terminal cleavage/methylation domain-containing protein
MCGSRGSSCSVNGYTLIELLVVISIMALLAALVVGTAKYASDNKKITRVQAELVKIATMIENYHQKLGFYPPSGNCPVVEFRAAVTPLYYELSGCLVSGASGNIFTTLGSRDTIDKSVIQSVFGMDSFANSAVEKGEARAFASTLLPGDVIEVNLGGQFKLLKVPVKGPQPWGVTNVWHYNSRNPTNNPNGFDLWAEIIVGSRTNVIGNWKR